MVNHADTLESGSSRRCLMTNDVNRAYFHAKVRGDIFVEIPPEDQSPQNDQVDIVGKLKLSL